MQVITSHQASFTICSFAPVSLHIYYAIHEDDDAIVVVLVVRDGEFGVNYAP